MWWFIPTTVTVTGATVGNPAVAGFSSITTTNWQIMANVSGANTVFVGATNFTSGGAVNLQQDSDRGGLQA